MGGEGGGNEGRRGADQIGVEGRNIWRGGGGADLAKHRDFK